MTVIIMIATPGPVMMFVASAGLKGGYRKALQTIFGTNFASLILITVSILVLKGFLELSLNWFNAIKILGCLYIAYLGLQILKDVCFPKVDEDELSSQAKVLDGGFKQGFLVGDFQSQRYYFLCFIFFTVCAHHASFGYESWNSNSELDGAGFCDFITGLFGF